MYTPTPKDIQDIYGMRKIFEQAAVTSLKNIDNFVLNSFKELREKMEHVKNLPLERRRKEYAETEVVHTLIIYRLNNNRINKVYRNLHDFVLLFQHLIQRDAIDTTKEGLEEHLNLVNAILSKKTCEAKKI